MASLECIREAVRRLVLERQALRENGADRKELESNRLELVARQQQFSHALIEHCIVGVTTPSSDLSRRV
jgi:hypothetical protein